MGSKCFWGLYSVKRLKSSFQTNSLTSLNHCSGRSGELRNLITLLQPSYFPPPLLLFSPSLIFPLHPSYSPPPTWPPRFSPTNSPPSSHPELIRNQQQTVLWEHRKLTLSGQQKIPKSPVNYTVCTLGDQRKFALSNNWRKCIYPCFLFFLYMSLKWM